MTRRRSFNRQALGPIALVFAGIVGVAGFAYSLNEALEPDEEQIETTRVEEENPVVQVVAGREYTIWQGYVFEDPDHVKTGSDDNTYSRFDSNIYDFDLEIILHEGRYDGELLRTLFEEVNAEHLERVQQIGCDIAENYHARAQQSENYEIPEGVIAYQERHCNLVNE